MIHSKPLVLLVSFILVACSNNKVGITPDEYYLPEAIIGKPYRQVIHLDGSMPHLTQVRIWPEDAGFYWRFSYLDSTYWRGGGIRHDRLYWNKREAGQGNAIEIIGTPNNNTRQEIKIGIWVSAYSNMFQQGEDSYKEYVIKRVSDSEKSLNKS